jgi:hypothetical protein
LGFGGGSSFAGGHCEELSGQGLDLALGGGGIDRGVGPGQRHYALHGHSWVIDRAMERGGGRVVFLGRLGAVADLGYQFLLRVEVVGQLGLQLPDLVE